MAKDFSAAAQALLGQSKNGKVNMQTVSAIMDSQQGKDLLKHLSGGGGDALKQAAAAAAEGDTGSAGRLLASLLSTKEGQALAKQVMEITKKT